MVGRVEDKVVLITGGISGLGAASAVLLAREGASVFLTDIREEKAEEALALVTSEGGRAAFHPHDVTSEEDWQIVISAAIKHFGKLDVVVNSAGLGIGATIEDASYEHFRRINAVNYDGVFLGTKYGIRGIRQSGNGGSIINISSIEGIVGDPDLAAYNGSKGGVRLLSKSAALHCAKQRYGIRVNTIHPGHIMTDMVVNYFNNMPDSETAWSEIRSRYPVGHLGEPIDIGYGVVYLSSDESKFITGAELVIDGGYTAQ